jgi:alanine transaminase
LIGNLQKQTAISFNMPVLTSETINPNVKKAQYAVRGPIVVRADEISRELQQDGSKYPFKDLVYCNIGNPQQLGQPPLSYYRYVLALVSSPDLIDHEGLRKTLPSDVFDRANEILGMIDSRQTGAYSHSQGLRGIRQHVADFIQERDNLSVKISPEDIFLTDGASPAVQYTLQVIIRGAKDGIMIPIPQYPLYSATIDLFDGQKVGYYLNEEDNWSLSVDELERSWKEATDKGIDVRALVVINPGNPSGAILPKDNMEEIVQFCVRRKLVLLADEVYQQNVYGDRPFISFQRVVNELGLIHDLEVISFHSASKGFVGECGRRGGYLHLSPAVDKVVQQEIYKLVSINMCPNVDGQIFVDLLVKPPKEGDVSYEQFCKERDAIMGSLKRRAEKLVKTLNTLEGVSCNPTEGAMYAFARITVPKAAVQEAEKKKISPDALYCFEMLEQTGVVCVPGAGFGQKSGEYHFRTTILPPEDKIEAVTQRVVKFHGEFMKRYQN